MSDADEVALYLIHPAMRPWLDEFFQSRGFDVRRTPFLDDDDPDALPVYMPTLKKMGNAMTEHRCEETVLRGVPAGPSICNTVLDERGQCPNAGRHVNV